MVPILARDVNAPRPTSSIMLSEKNSRLKNRSPLKVFASNFLSLLCDMSRCFSNVFLAKPPRGNSVSALRDKFRIDSLGRSARAVESTCKNSYYKYCLFVFYNSRRYFKKLIVGKIENFQISESLENSSFELRQSIAVQIHGFNFLADSKSVSRNV